MKKSWDKRTHSKKDVDSILQRKAIKRNWNHLHTDHSLEMEICASCRKPFRYSEEQEMSDSVQGNLPACSLTCSIKLGQA